MSSSLMSLTAVPSFPCLSLCAGAKPAPGICFERVNSAGDPYGNCGKDTKGSFAKCDARYVSAAALMR